MNATQTSGKLPRLAFVSELEFGGATTFLCNLTGELVRRGVPVLVVSPKGGNAFASDFQTAGVKVVLQGGRLIFEDRMHAVLQTLAKFRPTAVVGCLGGESYEALRYVPPGIRRIAIIQGDQTITYDAAIPYAGYLDAIVGISTKITERLAKMEAFRAVTKCCLLHGVPIPADFEPRGRGSQLLRILYLGRITDGGKRVFLFPKILADLKNAGIPFQWTIAGDGDQRAQLERLMASDEPGRQVIFTGPLPNARVPDLLEKHDVFLLASDSEGLPISLLEAMAHGVVPVVTDLESGIRDVVNTGNGMLVPVDDVEGYARAMIQLHEHRNELAAKSAAARARVQTEFSVAAMADRWLAAFPTTTAPVSEWHRHWDITAPLTERRKFLFFKPIRVLRRLVKKIQR